MAPRIGVVLFPGTNCEHDAVQALRRTGADAELVWHGTTSLGHYATKVTSVIYKWLSGPILVAGLLGVVIKKNWNRHEAESAEQEKETGLHEQL